MLVVKREDKVIIRVDEWCNSVTTNSEGTFLEVDNDTWEDIKGVMLDE